MLCGLREAICFARPAGTTSSSDQNSVRDRVTLLQRATFYKQAVKIMNSAAQHIAFHPGINSTFTDYTYSHVPTSHNSALGHLFSSQKPLSAYPPGATAQYAETSVLLKASGQSSESSRHLDLHIDFIMSPSFSHGGVYEAQANFVRISLQLSFPTVALSSTMVLFSLSWKSSCAFSGMKVSVHFASLHCLFFTDWLQDRPLVFRRNRTNTSMASKQTRGIIS